MRTPKLLLIAALALFQPAHRASAAPPSTEELTHAVVRLSSHGASATVIATQTGRTLLLSCGHAFRGADRAKAILVDAPHPAAGRPKQVGVRLLQVDYEADLSLIELGDGPLPFVAPVAPAGHSPGSHLLSVGFDEMKWPATKKSARLWRGPEGGTDSAVTHTFERPWHGRSGGALLDLDTGHLIGVVSGYEVSGQRRGIYASHGAILRFLSATGGGSVQGREKHPAIPPQGPEPGIGVRPVPFGDLSVPRPQLSAPPPFSVGRIGNPSYDKSPFCPPGKS